MERNQSTENRDGENLRTFRGEDTPLARRSLRHLGEIERLTLGIQEAERETARTQSSSEDAQNTVNSWSHSAEEVYPTGVGSGDTALLMTTHTPLETSQPSHERSFIISNSFFSSDGCGKPYAKKKKTNIFSKSRRSTLGLVSLEVPVQKCPNNTHTTQRLRRNHVPSSQQNSGVPKKKEAERSEFEKFPNSETFVHLQDELHM